MVTRTLSYLTHHTKDMVELLAHFTGFDSPAKDKEAVERLVQEVAKACRERGGTVERVPSNGPVADNLRCTFAGEQADEKPVLLLAHIDTVWDVGETGKRPFRVEGDKAFGPGTYDMKAGLVQALFALQALSAGGTRPRRPVTLLVTTDEEIGSPHSRELIENEARRSAVTLVAEPSAGSGALKTARKSVGMYTVIVAGKAAHAGIEPEAGVSALVELAHQIIEVQSFNDFAQGTTVTVGVASGGTRTNVVPAEARAYVDVRAVTVEEAERIDGLLKGLRPRTPGASLQVTGGMNRPPMERTEHTARLFAVAREIAGEIGFDLHEELTGGGSDGNFTAAVGCPTLDGLGAVGGGAHGLEEHVVIPEMPRRAALLAGLLARL